MITFRVKGIPAPQGSKRHIGNGRMIESSKKVGPWRDAVRIATHLTMTAAGIEPFDVPLLFVVTFYLPRPSSAPKRVIYPAKYPDLSKLIRSTEDGMTDRPADAKGNKLIGAWADDARVVKVIASKEFATITNPAGAEITVCPIDAHDALAAAGAILHSTIVYPDVSLSSGDKVTLSYPARTVVPF